MEFQVTRYFVTSKLVGANVKYEWVRVMTPLATAENFDEAKALMEKAPAPALSPDGKFEWHRSAYGYEDVIEVHRKWTPLNKGNPQT